MRSEAYTGVPRDVWAQLKHHFRRKTAFNVTSDERKAFRKALHALQDFLPESINTLNALPVSTTEWASSTYTIGNHRIALVDVEQANAMDFLVAKAFLKERPISFYTEFMVRAAEWCLNNGDIVNARAISDKCNKTLQNYSLANGSYPVIPRPHSGHKSISQLLEKNITLAFVTGHELGHLLQDNINPTLTWIQNLYKRYESEPSKHSPKGQFSRFLKPECVQKFDNSGKSVGDVILGIKFINKWESQKQHLLREAHADCMGLISATDAAIDSDIPPEDLFTFLFLSLEASEMLMMLKRTLPRIPRAGEASAVAFEHSSLGFRRFVMITALKDIRLGALNSPTNVAEYWKRLPTKKIHSLIKMRDKGIFESASNRIVHISRAALHLSICRCLPPAPSAEQIRKQWGPFAGNGFFLNSFRKIPIPWLMIDMHNHWQPNDEDEPLPIGFASALHDVCNIFYHQTESFFDTKITGSFNQGDNVSFEMVRHPRSQLSYWRCFNINNLTSAAEDSA